MYVVVWRRRLQDVRHILDILAAQLLRDLTGSQAIAEKLTMVQHEERAREVRAQQRLPQQEAAEQAERQAERQPRLRHERGLRRRAGRVGRFTAQNGGFRRGLP